MFLFAAAANAEGIIPVGHAEIQWGAGGIRTHDPVEVDLVKGAAVSVGAAALDVVMFNDEPTGTVEGQFGAFVSYLPYGGDTRPTRTVTGEFLEDGGGTATRVIPTYARWVQLQITNPVSVPVLLEFLNAAGTAISGVLQPATRTFVPNDARSVRITNEDPNDDIADFRLVFGLAL